jgi:hypothetical protein
MKMLKYLQIIKMSIDVESNDFLNFFSYYLNKRKGFML